MKKRYIISLHFAILIALFLIGLFTSEPLLNLLMPGTHNVSSWLLLMAAETVLILTAVTISCIIFIKKQKKSDKSRHSHSISFTSDKNHKQA